MSNREDLIKEKIRHEEAEERRDIFAIRRAMLDFLINSKGYLTDDIEIDAKFEISAGNRTEAVSTDFIIKLAGVRFMAVKCAPSTLGSRERHILSFCRVVDSYQIPYCLITDGEKAIMLDTLTGKTMSEDFALIPSRTEALEKIKGIKLEKYPDNRLEREKLILLAYQCANCPIELTPDG